MEPTIAYHVYAVIFVGSNGHHQIGPLFTHRSHAKAYEAEQHRQWLNLKASGAGQIFGTTHIERLPVAGAPRLL